MNKSDDEILEILKRAGVEMQQKVLDHPKRRRVDVESVLAEVRKHGAKSRPNHLSWWHRFFGAAWPRTPITGLAWATAVVLLLGVSLWLVVSTRTAPVAFAFAAGTRRGTPPAAEALPLDGEYRLELDLAKRKIRFVEAGRPYSGALDDSTNAMQYGFVVRGTNQSGESVVITGTVILTPKVSAVPTSKQEHFSEAFVKGDVKVAERAPVNLEPRPGIPRE